MFEAKRRSDASAGCRQVRAVSGAQRGTAGARRDGGGGAYLTQHGGTEAGELAFVLHGDQHGARLVARREDAVRVDRRMRQPHALRARSA